MPQAKVIAHLGAGTYLIELQMDWSILDRKIADANAKLTELAPQLIEAEANYNNLKVQYDALVEAETLALEDLVDANNDPSRESERKALTEAVIVASNETQRFKPTLQTAFDKWQVLLAKQKQANNVKEFAENYPRTNTITQAQAVDKIDGTVTEEIESGGTYPTLAFNTMIDVYMLAREASAPWWIIPPALEHNESTIPALKSVIDIDNAQSGNVIANDLLHSGAIFWNSAMNTGYQRWNPIIRHGVITQINDIEFTVRLTPTLNSVDLQYQGEQDTFVFGVDYFCGTSAFMVGDEVVVRIDSNWVEGNPFGYVIGFANGPARECQYSELPTGDPIFTWPRLFYDCIIGAPPVPYEDYGSFISDEIFGILASIEGAESEMPEFTDPYDHVMWIPYNPGWTSGEWFFFAAGNAATKCSLVLRDPDYPDVPDLPGTGTIAYTHHGSSAGLTIDLSANIQRRCLTVDLPAPQLYAVGGTDAYKNTVIYTKPLAQWYRNPTTHDFSGPNGSEVPQPSREFRRDWANNKLTVFNEIYGTPLPFLATYGDIDSTISQSYLADNGLFEMNAVINDNGNIINTSKTYALNKIHNNGLGVPMTAEFWVLDEPTKFYI